ncbi:hypothetical protein [Staphylococcus agnetis]|uniref:Uncharacterized protein n=1 Tax=Staphylococcus agnetis TaxID=985762 RepID=A0ABX3Z2Z0_9STAP|nr:hypothetical protein [Staphylococcus agnetis]MDG4943525.1 hypothetical protein [Staphylococcus agnetis]OSP16815.1 hypothetical protein B9L42_10655 [Staphylococcus agnetis]OSP22836.1 hypothetical protein B9M87_10405 [Staphylococcus agnetis]OTW30117.1 hypothetical protein B9M88_11990 [Staphylococcus agnetis]
MSLNELLKKFMDYRWSLTDVIFLMFFPSLFSILFGPFIGIPAGLAFFIFLFMVNEADENEEDDLDEHRQK